MTGDEYVALLLERQAKYRGRLRPLLEDLVEPGDEELFMPPPVAPQPKREPRPRRYVSSSVLRAERDAVQAELDRLTAPATYDPGVVNLSPASGSRSARSAGRRRMARLDNDITTVARLIRRRDNLDARITRAQHREHKTDHARTDDR